MEETIATNQMELPNNSVANDILQRANMNRQQEASQHLTENQPSNQVNSSSASSSLEDSSKECNMHLLANAVDRVTCHPPSCGDTATTTGTNVENVTHVTAGSNPPHGTASVAGKCGLSAQPLNVLPTFSPLPTTSNNTDSAVGLITVQKQDYSSSVQSLNSPMLSSSYLASGSSHTITSSVSSMHAAASSSIQYAANTIPSSIPLPGHPVHSSSNSSHVSPSNISRGNIGCVIESPSSSQHTIDMAASSVHSSSVGTIHRPANSMPASGTAPQPSSSELLKSPPTSVTQKPNPAWPSGGSSSGNPSAVTASSPSTGGVSLRASDPVYNPPPSLQSNLRISTTLPAPQLQVASSSVTFEQKPDPSSSSSMLGVSSSFESQSNVTSVSTSKTANQCSSDSAMHNNASVSAVQHHHLHNNGSSNNNDNKNTAGDNGPTSSASSHINLHSTTDSQDYAKLSAFPQPSSTMPGQSEVSVGCSSSLPESGHLLSTPDSYLPNQSESSPSDPSSSESPAVQVASSSLGVTVHSGMVNTDKTSLSSCVPTAGDIRDAVSGSTDSNVRPQSRNFLSSSGFVSDASNSALSASNPPLEKTRISSASTENITPASSSDVNNSSLQKVTCGSLDKVTSGSNDKVTSASSDTVTSASGCNVTNENIRTEPDKGIPTPGQPWVSSVGNNNFRINNDSENVTSVSGNVSVSNCVTSIASNNSSGKKTTSTSEKTQTTTGHVSSSPEVVKGDQNKDILGGKEQFVAGGSFPDSGQVTSGTNNVTLRPFCISSDSNTGNASSDSANITSASNNVSSGSEADGLKTRLNDFPAETDKPDADCSNSILTTGHSKPTAEPDRSNVSSTVPKSDLNSLSSSLSSEIRTNVQNSLHESKSAKEENSSSGDANGKNLMKADSSSSSMVLTKKAYENSMSKDENSCTSTIADRDINSPKTSSKAKSKKPCKKDETVMSASRANSAVSDSTSLVLRIKEEKEEIDSNENLEKTGMSQISKNKNNNLLKSESSGIKFEVENGSVLPSAEDQEKEAVAADKNTPNGENNETIKQVDTNMSSTDLGSDDGSPNKGQKRKRSQSPVSSSLAEPRRSRRQSKSKFNVLDLVGIGIKIDYSMEDEKRQIKEVTNSPAGVAESSLTTNTKDTQQIILDLADNEMEDISSNPSDSSRKFKEKIDMEKIIAPFEQGWRREVVIRGVYEEFTKSGRPKRIPADVYYYAPDKRKLRSMVQIVNYLREKESDLTSENFNFMRKSIYKAPFEVVRHAGSRGLGTKARPSKNSPKGLPKPEVVIDRDEQGYDACNTEEDDEDNHANIEPELELALAATALTMQQVVPSRWSTGSGEKKEKRIKSEPVVKMEIENASNEGRGGGGGGQHLLSAAHTPGKRPLENSNSSEKKIKKSKAVARKSTSQLPKSHSLSDVLSNTEPFQPCSLSCPGLVGIPPTLHCDICMCLFHIVCVNLKDNEVPKVFTCKNCLKDEHLVRNKLRLNTTSSTTVMTATPTTTTTILPVTTNSTNSSTIITSKSIPSNILVSIKSPTTNLVNTVTVSTTLAESDKKAKKVASKPSVIQSTSKDPPAGLLNSAGTTSTTSVNLPKKLGANLRQVVVNSQSLLNGSAGTESSPIEILSEGDSQIVRILKLNPGSPDHGISGGSGGGTIQNISNSIRPSLTPSRVKTARNTNSSLSFTVKKSPIYSQSSSTAGSLLLKDNVSIIAASPSGATIMTPTTPAGSTTIATTTTITATSSKNATSITAAPSNSITPSANSFSIDCTKDLTVKTSTPLTSESSAVTSSSKLPAASTHTLPPVTTSSIKMESLLSSSSSLLSTSSSSSSSSPSTTSTATTSSTTAHAHSGTGGNSVVGLQVSNTLLGTESYPRSGQLLTLPSAVAKRLNPSLPLALRINNMQLLIPPSRCINTAEGLKVFLPPKTFSVPSGSTTTMNITFSSGSMSADNAKDLSVSMLSKEKSMSVDMCNQVVDLSKTAEVSKPVLKVTERRNKMKNYLCPFKNLYSGYDSMIQIFSYLSAGDLVRCSLVCRTWRKLATQSCLWNAIHLENTRISDWARATQFFSRYLVEELSLRGMQYEDDWNRVWHQLTPVLEQLTTLKRLYFDHVPALMLYTVCQKLPQLEDLGANMISDFTNGQQWTTPTKIDLAKFCNLKHLKKLQLRGTGGLASPFSSGISGMVALKFLRHLSLTSMKGVGDHDLDYLGELKQLKTLEIGDCTNWTSETYFQLGKLVNLEKLRLEHGGEIPDVGLADALTNLKSLFQLELITFVIADNLHLALCQLKNLVKLVIWPDTSHQAALVNSNTFVTVIKLSKLKQLEWGVIRNKNSSIILNESRSVTTASNNLIGNDKELGDLNTAIIPFLSPDAQAWTNQTSNDNNNNNNNNNNSNQVLNSLTSDKFTEYIGLRQLSEKLKCLLTHTQVTVFRTLNDASCVSSW